MPPQRPDLILTTNIPNIKLGILVRDRLDIKSNRRDRSDVLLELKVIQDR